ncbi:hypothetical protein ACFQJ5_14825 [Halomicroarcula sp. GCM10025324]|uniref:hypothetical protein n=1 Tax=Haloarcula TaxID=2237 RepID=UPI0023E7CB3B|nr:hypothetical protein [Halomicroarcula sp. ZS-22-S1]
MPRDFLSIAHLRAEFRPFLSEYKSSILAWGSGILGTVLWIASSVLSSTPVAISAAGMYIAPAVGYYLAYRPFGIQIDLTPIAAVDGEKEPDKVAESRGEAILRSGECEIRGGVVVSERLDSFTIQFDVPDDIRVELRDIPCAEQMYDPEKKILRADDVSVYRFSIVLLVYFEEYVAGQTYEYPLKIRDGNGGKPIQSIDLVTR